MNRESALSKFINAAKALFLSIITAFLNLFRRNKRIVSGDIVLK